MNCFSCFSAKVRDDSEGSMPPPYNQPSSPEVPGARATEEVVTINAPTDGITVFTFSELATMTKNFGQECLIGEGRSGHVYKGELENTGQVVAVKQLDKIGLQGSREFLIEILMLSRIHHPNVANLFGYCAEEDQRLLVYEYLPLGSLEHHLFDLKSDQKPLDWNTRIKIALGVAKGLEYIHYKINPPVIFRDLKSSNILLNHNFDAKLSDFGFAKLGPIAEAVHLDSQFNGTYGYIAPEYQRTGLLTFEADVFSFGVLLLELITGRRVIDTMRTSHEENLLAWARPIFREHKRFSQLADSVLRGEYPEKSLNQAVALVALCVQEEPTVRPLISDVVTALSFL